MNSRHLLLITLVFNINLVAVLTKQRITVPLAEKLPEIQDRVITKYGCDHNWNHPKEKSIVETAQILDLLQRIDAQGEKCEVWVESDCIFGKNLDRYGVLCDLVKEGNAKGFKNIIIRDIDFRIISGAAHSLLAKSVLAKINYFAIKKNIDYLDEKFWIEKLNACKIMSIFPSELQKVNVQDGSSVHEKRYKYAYEYFGKLPDAESEEFKPTLSEFHEICQALIFVSRARESFPCDLRTLTFQHVIDEFNNRLKIAWQLYEELPDEESKKVYKRHLDGFLGTLKNFESETNGKRFAEVDKTRPILDITRELADDPGRIRESLNDHLVVMFERFINLDLFYKVIMLEKKSEIKKILIFTGTGHTDDLARLLEMTNRYKCLMHEFNPVEYQAPRYYFDGDKPIRVSTPLRVYVIDLAGTPRKNLEWEMWLRKWLYPIGWHIGFAK